MNTLREPPTMVAPQVTLSPTLAAGMPLMKTVPESCAISLPSQLSWSPTREAARPFIVTLGDPSMIFPDGACIDLAPIARPISSPREAG